MYRTRGTVSFAPDSLTTLVNNTSPGPRNFSQRSGGGPEGSLGHRSPPMPSSRNRSACVASRPRTRPLTLTCLPASLRATADTKATTITHESPVSFPEVQERGVAMQRRSVYDDSLSPYPWGKGISSPEFGRPNHPLLMTNSKLGDI